MGSQQLDTVIKPSPVQGPIASVLDEASFPDLWMAAVLLCLTRPFLVIPHSLEAGFSFFPFPVPFPSSSSPSSPYPCLSSFSSSSPTVLTHQGGSPLMTSSKPNYLPKASFLHAITLWIRASVCKFWGDTTFSL